MSALYDSLTCPTLRARRRLVVGLLEREGTRKDSKQTTLTKHTHACSICCRFLTATPHYLCSLRALGRVLTSRQATHVRNSDTFFYIFAPFFSGFHFPHPERLSVAGLLLGVFRALACVAADLSRLGSFLVAGVALMLLALLGVRHRRCCLAVLSGVRCAAVHVLLSSSALSDVVVVTRRHH